MFHRSNVRLFQVTLVGVLTVLALWSCSTVPLTGRQQLNLVSDSEMLAMSEAQYDTFLLENKVSTNRANTEMVRRIGTRIQGGVEAYLKSKGQSQQIAGYKWEFNLVESDQVNAWCMPGGKVVVYTGIIPVCQDEAGLAVVMGHEIAHAVAKHGAERMSQSMIAQGLGTALSVALAEKPAETQQLWMTAFGVGAQYGALLPFSRQQESEADHLGLVFMAIAGYDPQAAVPFWERMSQSSKGGKPPEIMSTHPSDETRIANLKKFMPEAMTYYHPGTK
jgi:predicted Zn-dependent protease